MWRKLGTANYCIRDYGWLPNGKILLMDEVFPVKLIKKKRQEADNGDYAIGSDVKSDNDDDF